MKFILLGLALMLMVCSCQSDASKSSDPHTNKTKNIYKNTTLGWSIEIPKDWRVVSETQFNNQNQEGKKALAGVMEGTLTTTGLQQLVSFQKDQYNVFQSTAEAVKDVQEWTANHKNIKEMMSDAFRLQGIQATVSPTRNEKINGLDFEVFEITIYDMNKEVLVQQISYSRYLKGYDFNININYNNPSDKSTMLKALNNSIFKK